MNSGTSYYEYEGIPCQVTSQGSGGATRAEGYFSGKGLIRMEVTAVLFYGTPLSEKEFRALVVALRRGSK